MVQDRYIIYLVFDDGSYKVTGMFSHKSTGLDELARVQLDKENLMIDYKGEYPNQEMVRTFQRIADKHKPETISYCSITRLNVVTIEYNGVVEWPSAI